jgi:hypothetical protein
MSVLLRTAQMYCALLTLLLRKFTEQPHSPKHRTFIFAPLLTTHVLTPSPTLCFADSEAPRPVATRTSIKACAKALREQQLAVGLDDPECRIASAALRLVASRLDALLEFLVLLNFARK